MATEHERNRGAGAYSTPGVDVKPDLAPAAIITGAPEVKFSHIGIGPPSNQYITREDALKVNVWNSLAGMTINVNYRLLRFDGVVVPNSFNIAPPANRVRTIFIFPVVEGFLLGLQLFAQTGSPQRGQTFVYAEIVRPPTGTVIGYNTLVSDYLTAGDTLGWPGGAIRQSVEGPGFLRSVAVPNPAAGADWSQAVPSNARWRLQCAAMQLVTGAAVANRAVECNLSDPTTTYWLGEPTQTVPASTTVRISFGNSVPTAAANVTDIISAQPSGVIQPAGHTINSRTFTLQAADQFSSINLLVEEWIDTT